MDPFLCAGCSQASYKKELVDLRNTVNTLQEEISQLRKILDEKSVYADAYVPPIPQIDGHQMKTQFSVCGVRDRCRGRGRGREQGRGEWRGRSGLGGHRSGCNE